MRHLFALRAARVTIAAALGLVLALARFSAGQGLAWGPAPALACGLGNTATMKANNDLALSYPLTPQDPPNTPIGVFALDYVVGQPIAFTEDLSRLATPVNPNDYHWNWDFGDGSKVSGYQVTHTYTKAGGYDVRVGLIDLKNSQNDDPNFDSAKITIIAQAFAAPPVAVATGSTTYVQIGGYATYDATGSHSAVGGALTYTWNFGDTTILNGPHVTHRFTILGRGGVALIVQDARGAKAYALVPVVVVPQLPTAAITASATHAGVGTAINFDASGSQPTSQPGDTILNYQWSFGDGGSRTTTTPTTTYSYAKAGTFTVTVQAIDKNGLPGAASLTVVIQGALIDLRNPIVLWGLVAVAVAVLLSLIGNWSRARREERERLAVEAARRARIEARRRRASSRSSWDDEDDRSGPRRR